MKYEHFESLSNNNSVVKVKPVALSVDYYKCFLTPLHSIKCSQLSTFEVNATNFYEFKLPEVQINLHFGKFGLVKKSPTPNYGLLKAIKMYF